MQCSYALTHSLYVGIRTGNYKYYMFGLLKRLALHERAHTPLKTKRKKKYNSNSATAGSYIQEVVGIHYNTQLLSIRYHKT